MHLTAVTNATLCFIIYGNACYPKCMLPVLAHRKARNRPRMNILFSIYEEVLKSKGFVHSQNRERTNSKFSSVVFSLSSSSLGLMVVFSLGLMRIL